MTEVPKIVHDRLRAALPNQAVTEGSHPDADLLTAFAEQALSATERDGVLAHLAHCADCRELIALALPALDRVATPVAIETEADRPTVARMGTSAPRKPGFAWPRLHWAALAAAVVVAAAVLVVHPGKLNQAPPSSATRQVAALPPASGPQSAASLAASSSVATPSSDQLAVLAKTEEAPPKPESRSSKKLKAAPIVMPPHQAEPETLLADNRKDSTQAANPPGRSYAYDASAPRAVTESVEVSGAAAAVEVAPSAEGGLMARNETTAIEKAKPALQEMAANEQKSQALAVPGAARLQTRNVMSAAKLAPAASPALTHNVTWTIAAGVLQRSLDSGQNWQAALHADHPLLCYGSYGEDVWAGGSAGTLFHSTDDGATWLPVQPSIKGQSLASDITHLDVRASEVVISTSNHETWSSTDNGKTWEKK